MTATSPRVKHEGMADLADTQSEMSKADAMTDYAADIMDRPKDDPERRALWMKFLRSRAPNAVRANTNKCPTDVSEKIASGTSATKDSGWGVCVRARVCEGEWGGVLWM